MLELLLKLAGNTPESNHAFTMAVNAISTLVIAIIFLGLMCLIYREMS